MFCVFKGFFELWNWVQAQNWIGTFCKLHSNGIDKDNMHILTLYINSEKFANAVYKFLKERNNG